MEFVESTDSKGLGTLLKGISEREIALPDFQRDFVWDPNATEELIASVANHYPAGSLLRVRNTPKGLFAHREFEGAPSLSPRAVPTFLILDGQQRLTSIYHALYGVGPHRYFLRLEELMNGAAFDDALFSLKATHQRAKKLEDEKEQMRKLIFPLSYMRNGSNGFSNWALSAAQARVESADEQMGLVRRLTELGGRWIRPLEDYKFPVVTLSANTPTEAICTIFETLNRRGVKLTVFELLTARYWPKKINLREMWEKANIKAIADFAVDPYYVLQIMSLAFRETPSCKRADVMNIDRDKRYQDEFKTRFEKEWGEAVDALGKALSILMNGCGVKAPKWLPYSTMLIPLAALLIKNPLNSEGAALKRQKIIRWFWCSVFGQRYESSPNTAAADDFRQVHTWLNGGQKEPDAISGFTAFNPESLRDVTPRQSALYRGVMCLILKKGAKDFYTDQEASVELINDNNIDDHHVFPDAHLKDLGVEKKMRDCVLNRTLISAGTNRSIGGDPPSKYMKRIQQARKQDGDNPELFSDMLRSHFIEDSASALSDNYESFLDERQTALGKAIKELCG